MCLFVEGVNLKICWPGYPDGSESGRLYSHHKIDGWFWYSTLYHLESRWRSPLPLVLVYHSPLLSHLLGVAPSIFTTEYRFGVSRILSHCHVLAVLNNPTGPPTVTHAPTVLSYRSRCVIFPQANFSKGTLGALEAFIFFQRSSFDDDWLLFQRIYPL